MSISGAGQVLRIVMYSAWPSAARRGMQYKFVIDNKLYVSVSIYL